MRKIVFLAAYALYAQDAQDPADVLVQVREKLLPRTNALSKYTCVQTVDRSYFVRSEASPRPSCDQIGATRKKQLYKLQLDHTDRMRFEVAFPYAHELFSWTDSGHFESLSLNELIDYGPNATGTFGTSLAEIFLGAGTHFQYRGRQGSLIEYGFHVSPEDSHSLFRGARQWMPTAYDGTVSINSQALDVERLTVDTADLPPETGLCVSETALDYRNAGSDNAGLLLPREGRTRFVLREGHQEIENRTTFSACREAQPRVVRLQPVPAALPDKLPVALELITPIDSDKSAEGDPVMARVMEDVLGSEEKPGQIPGHVYIVQGSTVRGRIMRIEHHLAPNRFLITLVFETVEIDGIERSFGIILDGARIPPFAQGSPPAGFNTLRSLQTQTFPTHENRLVVANGNRSYWRTAGIAAPPNPQDRSAGPKQ
jgi:hypothetical protein